MKIIAKFLMLPIMLFVLFGVFLSAIHMQAMVGQQNCSTHCVATSQTITVGVISSQKAQLLTIILVATLSVVFFAFQLGKRLSLATASNAPPPELIKLLAHYRI